MAKDTKERILEAALKIFSRDGYAGTNIKDIADEVGIVKSALYRHYASKEEIWKAVMDMMVSYYEEHFGPSNQTSVIPKTVDELYDMTMNMVHFTIHDTKIKQVRKLLITEQFRDEKMREFANDYFLYGMEARFTKVFKAMMDAGKIKKCDPKVLAFAYTSPITSLIHLCDRDPCKIKEAMVKLQQFVILFIEEYGVE